LKFLDRFSKNMQISNFVKIHPVGVELLHAGGRTDMTKLIVAIRNFAKAPKNIGGGGGHLPTFLTPLKFRLRPVAARDLLLDDWDSPAEAYWPVGKRECSLGVKADRQIGGWTQLTTHVFAPFVHFMRLVA
jgi:hypothetical protein